MDFLLTSLRVLRGLLVGLGRPGSGPAGWAVSALAARLVAGPFLSLRLAPGLLARVGLPGLPGGPLPRLAAVSCGIFVCCDFFSLIFFRSRWVLLLAWPRLGDPTCGFVSGRASA